MLGYDSSGALGVLRKGSNEVNCLADNPKERGILGGVLSQGSRAVHGSWPRTDTAGLRGREERHRIRWKDVDEGRVAMPRGARMLYVLTGKGYDATRDEVDEPYLRWVIYTPYATPESSGISASPGDSPWLMFPGTAGAPRNDQPAEALSLVRSSHLRPCSRDSSTRQMVQRAGGSRKDARPLRAGRTSPCGLAGGSEFHGAQHRPRGARSANQVALVPMDDVLAEVVTGLLAVKDSPESVPSSG